MILQIKDLYCGYIKGNSILKGINLNIGKNEVVAIIGQNGAGKSTLAKAILNFVPYINGKIIFDDEDIIGKSTNKIIEKGINIFMQGGRIFPHLTVEENLDFSGFNLTRREFENRRKEVKSYFDLFIQNENRTRLQASYLSGGEKHQLALAMTLMQKPRLLILDEPSAGLSPTNSKSIYKTLSKIIEIENICILLIEQNVDFAVTFSDKIILLSDGIIKNEFEGRETETINKIDEIFFKN